MRRAMIDSQLRTSGVNEPWIIAAMGAVPREQFVGSGQMATAYMDRAIPLGTGRALNPPLTAGLMLGAAALRGDDNVLLIGAATGYLARLIAPRVATLCAVEQSTDLLARARHNLSAIAGVQLIEGLLSEGNAQAAPYSVIIIDGAIAEIPDSVAAQLAEGGRVVTGLVDGAVSRLAIGYKRSGSIVLRAITDCEVAPLEGFALVKEFVF